MRSFGRTARWATAAGSFVVVAALTALVVLAVGLRTSHAQTVAPKPTSAQEAKSVARQFFRAIDRRRFGRACDLLSARFYQLNAIPSRQMCVLSLTYGMSTAGVRYRILGARGDRGHAEVTVLADGVRGRLQLIREGHGYKIVSLGAS